MSYTTGRALSSGARALLGALVLSSSIAVLCWLPAAASATVVYDFCGTYANPHYLLPGARCTDSNGHIFSSTSSASPYGAYDQCGIIKQNSDGSGVNESPSDCGFANSVSETCTGSGYSCNGFATIINHGGVDDYQYGSFTL